MISLYVVIVVTSRKMNTLSLSSLPRLTVHELSPHLMIVMRMNLNSHSLHEVWNRMMQRRKDMLRSL